MAAEAVDRLAPRLDLTAADDEIVTSLTQFDLLSILCAIADTGSLDTRSWYTNFARYDWSRSEPALVDLLNNEEMRREIFPLTDDQLAAALREIGRLAGSEGFRFAVWSGWQSEKVGRFLTDHA